MEHLDVCQRQLRVEMDENEVLFPAPDLLLCIKLSPGRCDEGVKVVPLILDKLLGCLDS